MTRPTFPSFYAECAWTDGYCDARDGTNSFSAYVRHGQEEPVGGHWYREGFAARASEATQ